MPQLARLDQITVPDAVWRGTDLGEAVVRACGTGWSELDRELPGGGWPARSLTEILSPQPSLLEFRLGGGALRHATAAGKQVVLVGAPKRPHAPGLLREGLAAHQVIWIEADQPAQRMWVVEQLVKSNAAGAIVAWLPQARAEQIRRLQIAALGCDAPVFLCRPESARGESSAAPLRLQASAGLDWELLVTIVKRRGPVHTGQLRLRSVPGGLEDILTPRLQRPSELAKALVKNTEAVDAALGSPAPQPRRGEQFAIH